uniref:Uncharacterized protein n=1 Tax=Setaria viridis TaxID=4556 RepID=A0A4U6TL94_SETVI|nr:hypothetical protein SEVIR_7G017400v2 [Setaria viridis]
MPKGRSPLAAAAHRPGCQPRKGAKSSQGRLRSLPYSSRRRLLTLGSFSAMPSFSFALCQTFRDDLSASIIGCQLIVIYIESVNLQISYFTAADTIAFKSYHICLEKISAWY